MRYEMLVVSNFFYIFIPNDGNTRIIKVTCICRETRLLLKFFNTSTNRLSVKYK